MPTKLSSIAGKNPDTGSNLPAPAVTDLLNNYRTNVDTSASSSGPASPTTAPSTRGRYSSNRKTGAEAASAGRKKRRRPIPLDPSTTETLSRARAARVENTSIPVTTAPTETQNDQNPPEASSPTVFHYYFDPIQSTTQFSIRVVNEEVDLFGMGMDLQEYIISLQLSRSHQSVSHCQGRRGGCLNIVASDYGGMTICPSCIPGLLSLRASFADHFYINPPSPLQLSSYSVFEEKIDLETEQKTLEEYMASLTAEGSGVRRCANGGCSKVIATNNDSLTICPTCIPVLLSTQQCERPIPLETVDE